MSQNAKARDSVNDYARFMILMNALKGKI